MHAESLYPATLPDLERVLDDRYGTHDLTALELDTPDTCSQRIVAEAQRLKRTIINRIPSRFIRNDDDLSDPIPQYQFPQWRSLDEQYRFYKPHGGVMLFAPGLWQFVYPFHLQARRHGLFVTRESFTNTPLAAEIVRQAQPTFLVAHIADVAALQNELQRRGVTDIIKTVVAFAGVDELPIDLASCTVPNANTTLEIHLFPGHVIAYQSFPLLGSTDTFHLDRRYLWEFNEDGTFITGVDESVLPLCRYRLPFSCAPTETISQQKAYTITPC
ncbi:MAG: hypothetical protein WDZ93_01520 [Candidatus Paceibacterota bacterium]